MFLKKVEISGFKSFASKTTLEFLPACVFGKTSADKPASTLDKTSADKPASTLDKTSADKSAGSFNVGKSGCGITAIVGPNGSGKSNVADAIRWVMGEQSMKNLRGKKSEDIIFAGSGKKTRLGSAWATLYFDNSDKRIPLEFSEVSITRKIFRSGESEYQINGSKVRLIDIIDLLAKAGVGKESYCVINQGMSDAVLNATPADRRTILEDAAGVKQFQIKKERAARKLDATKINLERVADLIKEIQPHLRMLKRQSEKAQKGKEIVRDLQDKQRKLFSYLWYVFEQEKMKATEEKNEIGARMKNLQRGVDKLADELDRESKKAQDSDVREKMESQKREMHQRLNELEKELVITEGRIEIEKEKLANQKMIETIPVDLGYVKDKLEKIRGNQEKIIARLDAVKSLEELREIRESAAAIQQEIQDLYGEVGKGKVDVKHEISKESRESEERTAALKEKKEAVARQIAGVKAEIQKCEKDIENEIEKDRLARQKFFQLERELHERQGEMEKFKDGFNEAKIKLAKLEVREEDLVNEIKNELKMEIKDLKYDGAPCDRDLLEREIFKLKSQAEQIGGIDPLVVEEYGETQKRFEFLSKESHDLAEAIKSLKEVVKEMDEKISKTFNKAFEQINKEFTKYFMIIFGGGNAHLIKTKIVKRRTKEEIEGEEQEQEEIENNDNPEEEKEEEVGIDISACPPGKRISHLSMLSGGERSLTSIALLFAIIAYNPPPFAIMDEVEAALDEANSRRFGRIVQELSSNTQFVIITHNRETMRQASLLYGVTMGEDGISKLLSVRMDQVGQGGNIVK